MTIKLFYDIKYMSEKLTPEEISSIVYFIKDKIRENNSDYHVTKDDVDEFKGIHPQTYSKLKKRSHDVTKKMDKIKKQYLKFKGGNGSKALVSYTPQQIEALKNLLAFGSKAVLATGKTVAQDTASAALQTLEQSNLGETIKSSVSALQQLPERLQQSKLDELKKKYSPLLSTLIASATQLQGQLPEQLKGQSSEQPQLQLSTSSEPTEPSKMGIMDLLKTLTSTPSFAPKLSPQEPTQKPPESHPPSSFSPEIVISIADKKCGNSKELCDKLKDACNTLKNKPIETDTEKLIKETCDLCNQYQPKQEGGKKYQDIFISNQKVFCSNSLHSLDSSSYYLN